MTLLLMKIVLAPGLVVATTLAGRRWGDRAAGLLGGLPVVVGPILLALALERGDAFAARAAAGALSGLLSLCVFMLAYAWCARVTWWLPAVAAAWVAFAAATLLLDQVTLATGVSLAAVAVAFAVTHVFLPADSDGGAPPTPARWDIPLRAGATVALVVTLTAAARVLGPHLSGLLAAFPVLASVLSAFTHARAGARAASEFLRGLVAGLASFAAFCFVVAVLLPSAGTPVAFTVAGLVALVVNAAAVAAAAPRGRALARQPAG